jgi:RHH-type rel operon transcriptional repressor/antitoxin RelB
MPLSVRLDADTQQRLKVLAERTGRTTTYYVREAIEKHLDDLEDIYLADQAIEELRRGRARTYTLEEVERELGLAN